MPPLTNEQREAIKKQDAKNWRRYGCFFVVPGCSVFIFLILICLLVLICQYAPYGVNTESSEDEVIKEVPSPDGSYTAAVVFRQNGFAIGVSAEPGKERVVIHGKAEKSLPDKRGHINYEVVYYDEGTYNIEMKWIDKRTLEIDADCSQGKPTQETSRNKWRDVALVYHECSHGE